MKRSLLANNIGILRTAFGETQLDLALVLGLNSPNTISNYESGNRKPNDETIRKLARHYNITVYELCNIDLSFYLALENFFQSEMFWLDSCGKNILLATFPVILTDEVKNNKDFMSTYKKHLKLYDDLSKGKAYSYIDKLIDEVFDEYLDLYCEKRFLTALANLFVLYYLSEFLENCNDRLCSNNKFFSNISKLKFKDIYLRECDFIDFTNSEENDDSIERVAKKLMRSPMFKDLVYYFKALRYVFGVGNKNFSFEMNQMMGCQMIDAFSECGNEYASNYKKLFHDIYFRNEHLTERERQTMLN